MSVTKDVEPRNVEGVLCTLRLNFDPVDLGQYPAVDLNNKEYKSIHKEQSKKHKSVHKILRKRALAEFRKMFMDKFDSSRVLNGEYDWKIGVVEFLMILRSD